MNTNEAKFLHCECTTLKKEEFSFRPISNNKKPMYVSESRLKLRPFKFLVARELAMVQQSYTDKILLRLLFKVFSKKPLKVLQTTLWLMMVLLLIF